jgi:hypothetical protein
MFCHDVVRADLERLRRTGAPNAFIGQAAPRRAASPGPSAAPRAPVIQDVFARIATAR